VIEICPASTLTHLRISSDGYKGRGSEHRARRVEILGALSRLCLLSSPSPEIEQTATSNNDGDALDAIVAAVAVSRAVSQLLSTASTSLRCLDEGRVYF
jgi:hypothetical protein